MIGTHSYLSKTKRISLKFGKDVTLIFTKNKQQRRDFSNSKLFKRPKAKTKLDHKIDSISME